MRCWRRPGRPSSGCGCCPRGSGSTSCWRWGCSRAGLLRVWDKLTAGLEGLTLACPSVKALRDLRRRLGPAPLKALFEVVAGPLGQPHPGGAVRGLRTVAFDGCKSIKVPDTARNRAWLGKIRHRWGWPAIPRWG